MIVQAQGFFFWSPSGISLAVSCAYQLFLSFQCALENFFQNIVSKYIILKASVNWGFADT